MEGFSGSEAPYDSFSTNFSSQQTTQSCDSLASHCKSMAISWVRVSPYSSDIETLLPADAMLLLQDP